jgi:hypothetical protein
VLPEPGPHGSRTVLAEEDAGRWLPMSICLINGHFWDNILSPKYMLV